MPAVTEQICYNCFKERPDAQEMGPCPYCGFDLRENQEEYPTALKAGTLLNQRYLIGRVLGQGGFGITYLAWDESLEAKVAVKEYMPGELADRTEGRMVHVISGSRQEEFSYGQERFREEARILAKFMGQPCIAGVTDYFDENGTSYFVMDYIEGISFKTYIAGAGGKVSVQEALDVMIPVLRALTAVHGEGLIHRDVTPDNIYITKDGNVKLLDFGSARYSLGDKSKSLDVILKVGYAPKEQYIRRGRQGPYTDVYSCAACLYGAITGYLPPESLERLDHDTLVPPSKAGVEIPLYLERAILKGLAVQPEDRFQTAGEFLEALESQQVVELAPERAGDQALSEAAPSGKKKPYPLLAGGALLVLAAAGAVMVFLGGRGGNSAQGMEDYQEEAAVSQNREEPVETVEIGGRQYPTNLTSLDLRKQGLGDEELAGLSRMTRLEILDLRGNDMTDLTPLSGLNHLKELRLSGDIEGNEGITDLTPLKDLSSLKVLHLPAANLEDLTPLSGLTRLEDLALTDPSGDHGFVEDITPLAPLVNLKELYLKIAVISDLTPLSGMTQLESLRIRAENYVTDYSPLSEMKHLKELEMAENQFPQAVDISPLSSLTSLESLRMGCNVQDLEPLRNLSSLRKLMLDGRTSGSGDDVFDSLEPLSALTKLEDLTLQNDLISDLSPLAGLSNLKTLSLTMPRVTDLSPLSGLAGLEKAEIQGGEIADWSPLAHVPDVTGQ